MDISTYEAAKEFPREFTDPRYEVADIFREYGPAYRGKNKNNLSPLHQLVMRAVENCRTRALGAHIKKCDHCAHYDISYNSCRNRNCPKCRASQRSAWVDARELELLPIQYFHVVFTLPQALVPLARFNPEIIYSLLFRVAAETLQAFAQTRWAAKLGIIAVLHTWGQTMQEHLHVHCIVTGGALKEDGSGFVPAPQNFLFPVKALSRVFREKYLSALEVARAKGELVFLELSGLQDESGWSGLRAVLYRHKWVVYAKRPFDKPQHLLRYLGRYINRIAIANHRIQSIDNGIITFTYLDNRDNQEKEMDLTADEFIRRFLTHVLPKGFGRIRYYGFLVNRWRKVKLAQCRAFLGLSDPDKPYISDMDAYLAKQDIDPNLCPKCGVGEMREVYCLLSFHDPPACYQEAV